MTHHVVDRFKAIRHLPTSALISFFAIIVLAAANVALWRERQKLHVQKAFIHSAETPRGHSVTGWEYSQPRGESGVPASAKKGTETIPTRGEDWKRKLQEADARLSRIEGELVGEKESNTLLKEQLTAAEQSLGLNTGEQTIRLGDAQSVARKIGAFLHQVMPKRPAQELPRSPDDAPSRAMEFFGLASALQDLESQPAEIVSFQSALLNEFYPVEPTQREPLEATLRAGYARLREQGLSATQKPEQGGEANWEERRDMAIRSFADEVQRHLPKDAPLRELLPGLLGIAEGLRRTVSMGPDGHGSASLSLPNFPEIRL